MKKQKILTLKLNTKKICGECGTLSEGNQKCLFKKLLPDPDFKYFSNSNALYLSLNEM